MYYCCVRGCKNNIKMKMNDSGSNLTFHLFPQNPILKMKWLEAIGHLNWDVPTNALVCSDHFDRKNILNEAYVTDNVVINNEILPEHNIILQSNIDASDVEVCCLCLASDVKMYSSQGDRIRSKIEQLGALTGKFETDWLPCYVCYMCVMEVHKCCQFIDKCVSVQATLLDMFHKHGKVTKNLIKELNRKVKLSKSLSIMKQSNIEYVYENSIKNFKTSNPNLKEENDCKIDLNLKEESDEEVIFIVKSPTNDNDSDTGMIHDDNDSVVTKCSDENTLSMLKSDKSNIQNEKEIKQNTGNGYDLTNREMRIKQYFNIVKLPLEEQIDEWNRKSSKSPIMGDAKYLCESCPKQFAHFKPFTDHQRVHDKSRGKVECSVCRARFKRVSLAEAHRRFTHEKRYHCKLCSKIVSNVKTAIRHNLWHSGIKQSKKRPNQGKEEHSCIHCGITCTTIDVLNEHVISTHEGEQVQKSDKSYHCETCDIKFTSEDAIKLHTQTSNRHKHKKKSSKDSKSQCYSCGSILKTEAELSLHMKTQHIVKPYRKESSRNYPMNCEYCSKTINNRRDHWWHTIKEHPDKKDSYSRVITAVCDTCGQGFQNSTKLHIHELRHSPPSVKCAQCGRAFYDKYALARHARTHTRERPYVCAHCGQTFTLRHNLYRHAKVHSNVAAYECSICDKKFKYTTSRNLHIRTVHYKQPPPPRKKKTKTIELETQ